MAIENYLLNTDSVDPEHCVSLLQRSLKKKADAVVEAVEGFHMTLEQKERVRIIQGHFADIDKRIGQIDEIVSHLVAEYESQISLLCTVPGIDRRLAITIISEIGADMSEFGSSRKLCAWAGLAPGSNQSAGKKKSVKITRAGVYLKPALVEAAHAAVKSTEKQPYFRMKYERIMKRRGKKRAIIAIARMILTSIYAMLSSGEVFNPSDLQKYDMAPQYRRSGVAIFPLPVWLTTRDAPRLCAQSATTATRPKPFCILLLKSPRGVPSDSRGVNNSLFLSTISKTLS